MEDEWEWSRYFEARKNLLHVLGSAPRGMYVPPAYYRCTAREFRETYEAARARSESGMLEPLTLVLPQAIPSFVTEWRPPQLPRFHEVLQHVARQQKQEATGELYADDGDDDSDQVTNGSDAELDAASTKKRKRRRTTTTTAAADAASAETGAPAPPALPARVALVIQDRAYECLYGNETLVLFFSERSSLGVDPIEQILIYCQQVRAGRVILVADNPTNPDKPLNLYARNKLLRLTHPDLHFQYFALSTLAYSMENDTVDRFHVLTPAERAAFFADHPTYQPKNMPVMLWDDVGRMLYDLKLGDVVKTTNVNGAATFLIVALDK